MKESNNMSTFKKKVQWNINQSLICLMLFTLFIISNLIVYPDNAMAGVSYSHYKSTSTDLWERKAAYLWENINRITKELQDAIHDKAQNPPSNELVKAVGSDKEKSSLVSQHNDLKQNADTHFLPPPDLDPMKQLCRTICDMKPPQQKGVQLTDDIKKLKEEKKELEKTRDHSDYWMKNFTLQKGANAIDESLKKFVDIAKAVLKPDSLAGILGKWMKEYSNWKPTDLRLPDGPFVKKYQKEIDTRFNWEIQRYMPHKEQEWISIMDKLHKGAKVSDLSRTEQQEFETIVKRYHRCIREEAEAQLSGRRNKKGTIIKAGVIQKITEKEKQKIVAQKHDKKAKEIEDNIKKFKALCDKIALLTDWTPVTATPQIHISSAADRTAATSGDSVKYTYTVTNRGNVPLVNVKVKDNKSPSIPLLRGDANSNGVLEKGETWIYESSQVLTSTSSTPISISNTAEATADGQKGGSASPASATAAVTVSAIMVTVPDVLGLTPAQAKETIKAAKLVVGDINKEESTQHKGLVSRQSPEAGKSIVLGSSVTIWLSKGQKKEVRRLFIDPPTKTTEMEKPVQLRALLWHTDGSEVDVTKKANWTGAEKGIFTPQKPGTYQITATYNDFSGSATVIVREPTWSAIEDKPPISSADDVDANVPLPPADAYTWYVFCDPQTGEVTYGEHHQPGLRVMVGPFPGPRTAEKWIRDNCPRGRCTTDGRCAKEPARGGKWCVICDKNSGEITFSEHKPDSLRFRVMAGGLLGEPEARLWLEQNCPSQRCTSEGTCATLPAIAPTGTDGWYVTCFLPAGKIEIGKKPFDPRTDKEIAGPFLGEPNARWWVDQNCPSWQCNAIGQCLTLPPTPVTGRIAVPNVVGMPAAQAQATISAPGLIPSFVGGDPAPSEELKYTVQSQSPGAGTELASGGTVTITLYDQFQLQRVRVPEIVGMSAQQAKAAISAVGLTSSLVGGDPAPSEELKYTVQSQSPGPNEEVEIESVVTAKIYGDFETQKGAGLDEESQRDRCSQLLELYTAAFKANDISLCHSVLDQAQDCPFYGRELAAVKKKEETSEELKKLERCSKILDAIIAASKANDLNRCGALLAQATDCPYYADLYAAYQTDLENRRQRSLQRREQFAALLGSLVGTAIKTMIEEGTQGGYAGDAGTTSREQYKTPQWKQIQYYYAVVCDGHDKSSPSDDTFHIIREHDPFPQGHGNCWKLSGPGSKADCDAAISDLKKVRQRVFVTPQMKKGTGTGGGRSWDECVNKYCPMCAGAISLLEESASEECNKCKEKYRAKIQQCVQGN